MNDAETKTQKDHRHGHRDRLRKRLLEKGADSLQDYETLEMLLHFVKPRCDTKDLAKDLLKKYGSIEGLIHEDRDKLLAETGIGEACVAMFLLIRQLRLTMLKDEIKDAKTVLSAWPAVIDHCRSSIGFSERENFKILLLDSNNRLIEDVNLAEGTVNKVTAYPREVARLALKHNAVSVVLAHNHPSGDTTPSKQDIEMTKTIRETLASIDVSLHDHLIISPEGYTSFKTLGLI